MSERLRSFLLESSWGIVNVDSVFLIVRLLLYVVVVCLPRHV